jgi:peptidoglycan/xylan/chitin deacetylase (PgdA/CDA1 family)
MPETTRRSSRRSRRKTTPVLPLLGLAAAIVVVAAVAFAWWAGIARHGATSAQTPQTAGRAATPHVVPAASKSRETTAASSSAADAAAAPDDPAQDPAVAEAAQASLSAAEKAAVEFPGAPSVSPRLTSINHLHPRHKYIALTLDDGYNFQPALLDLLKQYDVHCTTFLIGSWAASHKADVQAMKDAGFEIGNHSWTHPFLTKLSSAQVASELTKTQRVLTSITGNQAPYLRPPFGATNPSVKATAARLGYRIVMWDRTFGDSGRGATPAKLYSNVVYSGGGVQPGDVILCHWGSKPSYEALKKILPDLRAKGFQFVTISELIADSK